MGAQHFTGTALFSLAHIPISILKHGFYWRHLPFHSTILSSIKDKITLDMLVFVSM